VPVELLAVTLVLAQVVRRGKVLLLNDCEPWFCHGLSLARHLNNGWQPQWRPANAVHAQRQLQNKGWR